MLLHNALNLEDCDVSICEQPGFISGVKGVCNNITGLCDCPEGFSGLDFWMPSKSCEVSEVAAKALSSVVLALTACTIIIAGYFFISTFIRLGYYREIKASLSINSRAPESIETTTLSGIMERDFSTSRRTLKRKKAKPSQHLLEKRKRWIVATMGMLVMNPVLHLPYFILLVLDEPIYRYQVPYLLDISMSLALAIIPGCLWMVAYVYYMTLPGLERLRKILQVESFLFNRDRSKGFIA